MRGQGPYGIGNQEDFSRWKPKNKLDWMTMMELARHVDRDVSWLRRLDRQGKLPKAARFKVGRLSVRLYSPTQQAKVFAFFRAREKAKVANRAPKRKKSIARS